MFDRKKNPFKKYGMDARKIKEYHAFFSLQYGDMQDIAKEAKRLNRYCKKMKMNDRCFYVHPCSGMPDMGVLLMARK